MRTLLRRNGGQCVHARIHAVLLNLCTFSSRDELKIEIFQCKHNSESIGGVVTPHTCTHILLNEQFQTLTCNDVS